MDRYDAALVAAKKREEDLANQVDDDGFTLVTKASAIHAKPAGGKLAAVLGQSAAKPEKADKKPAVLNNFYRFQMRQQKRDRTFFFLLCVGL
jgi:hypothetical protein